MNFLVAQNIINMGFFVALITHSMDLFVALKPECKALTLWFVNTSKTKLKKNTECTWTYSSNANFLWRKQKSYRSTFNSNSWMAQSPHFYTRNKYNEWTLKDGSVWKCGRFKLTKHRSTVVVISAVEIVKQLMSMLFSGLWVLALQQNGIFW